MKKQLKQSFLSGLVFSGTVLLSYVGFAAFTALPTQDNGATLNKDIWNSLVSAINDIGARTDGIYNNGGNIGIGTSSAGRKLEVNGTIKSASTLGDSARAICYSVFNNGNANKRLIIIPLNSNNDDLDARCNTDVNVAWYAAGVAKSNAYQQNCGADIDNISYGGGYTSYVEESFFEANRTLFTNCNSTNAVICCSPEFPN